MTLVTQMTSPLALEDHTLQLDGYIPLQKKMKTQTQPPSLVVPFSVKVTKIFHSLHAYNSSETAANIFPTSTHFNVMT